MLWTAKIRLPNGCLEDVMVDAASFLNAKLLLEQIFGADSLFIGPMQHDLERRGIRSVES
jgi:hypothetical protein